MKCPFQKNKTIYNVKLLFENWRNYLKEEKKEISSKDELRAFLEKNPSKLRPTNINIDNPKGSTKSFASAEEKELPFDYGEIRDVYNTADNMGWDLIFAPGSSKTSQNLQLVGHIEYADGSGNDKMIVASGGAISSGDKETIKSFFDDLEGVFKDIEWY